MTREVRIDSMAKAITPNENEQALICFGAVWADSHPNWISVEDELPKENERIIAYNGVFNEIHLCDFHDGIFEDFYGSFNETITHWMPIVPPRKEE